MSEARYEGDGRRRHARLLCVTVDPEVARGVVALAQVLPRHLPGVEVDRVEVSWMPDAGDLALTVLLRKPDAVLLDLATEGAIEALEAHAGRLLRGVPGVRPAWFCLTRARTTAVIPPAARGQVGQLWKPLDEAAPEVVARGIAEARARDADVVIDRYRTVAAARPPSPGPSEPPDRANSIGEADV